MELIVRGARAGDKWKDFVRITHKYRVDDSSKHIPRGCICRISTGGKSKWVIVHGREIDDNAIEMDVNLRLALAVKKNHPYSFEIKRICWPLSLWFPWKASDPIYRIPAQLSLISFILGLVLGLAGLLK